MSDIKDICTKGAVIPVVEIEDSSQARPLADALLRGGIEVIEITLRTEHALEAIAAISDMPNLVVGAGTILTAESLKSAKSAGAKFGVSPGTTRSLIEAIHQENLPFLPGAATPSEVAQLMEQGFSIQKFFPAEQAGGIAMLKAIAGPLPEIQFCPTGGISQDRIEEYLELPNTLCVGGSWIASKQLIAEQNWEQIESNAQSCTALMS